MVEATEEAKVVALESCVRFKMKIWLYQRAFSPLAWAQVPWGRCTLKNATRSGHITSPSI